MQDLAPYYLVAAVLQLGVGGALIASRPRGELNWALGLLLAFNGIASLGPTGIPELRLAEMFDYPTIWMILLVGLLHPQPPRWLSRPGAVALCTLPALASLAIALLDPAAVFVVPWPQLMQSGPLAIAFLIVLVRHTPAVLGRGSKVSRAQSGLLLGAIAFRGAELSVMQVAVIGLPETFIEFAPRIAWLAVLVAALTVVALLARATRRGNTEALPPLALLLVGLALGTMLALGHNHPLDFFSLYYLRPIVVAYAVLRYQLLGATFGVQRALATGTLAAGAVVVFLGVQAGALVFVRGGAGTDYVADLAGISGVLVGAHLLRQRGVFRRVLAHPTPEHLDRENLELYRAEVEDAVRSRRAGPLLDDPLLRRLRERAGISERDHALIEFAVRAAEPPTEAPRELMDGRYAIVQALGQGAHGRTLLCRRTSDGALCAVKELLPHWRADPVMESRFRREAETLLRVRHPNVVRVVETYLRRDRGFLVMEYAEEGSLEQRLSQGPLPPREALSVAAQVLAGLEAIHAAGIIHGDLKPSNILFVGGRAKVADFGVARDMDDEGTMGRLDVPGFPGGTLRYMAPEQVGGGSTGPRTDLYAVAAVLHETITGEHYLPAGYGGRQLADAIATRQPALDHPALPDSVKGLLRRGLAKSPAERFADARAMRKDVERATGALGGGLSPSGRAGGSGRAR